MLRHRDLTSNHLVDVGEAIGIIAAQSIGEPGTQLTMRTFHTGGTVSGGGSQSRIEARHDGTVRYDNVRVIERPVEANSGSEDQQPNTETEKVVVSRNAQIRIVQIIDDENEYTVERHAADVGARLYVEDGQTVTKGNAQNGEQSTLLLEWDPYQVPILTEHAGRVVFKNIDKGKTAREERTSGSAEWVIIEHRGEDQPQIEIHDDAGEVLVSYQMPTGAYLSVPVTSLEVKIDKKGDTKFRDGEVVKREDVERENRRVDENDGQPAEYSIPENAVLEPAKLEVKIDKKGDTKFRDGEVVKREDVERENRRVDENDGQPAEYSILDLEVEPGAVLARLPREKGQSRDIVTGLPRVTELFEARRPKDTAVISKIEGVVELESASRGARTLRVVEGDAQESHRIPQGKHLIVQDNDRVAAGERLTDGPINPHDILEVSGEEAVQNYLVNEVQDVYRIQGERINDKHIEVIVRQMLGKVEIVAPGDTEFLEEEEVERTKFNQMNRRVVENDGQRATARPILQGITKASLSTESFISAASFQQTTNVLTRASVVGKRDRLVGLKENVIMGHLIPAGTGVSKFRKIRALPTGEAQLESDGDTDVLSSQVDEPAAD